MKKRVIGLTSLVVLMPSWPRCGATRRLGARRGAEQAVERSMTRRMPAARRDQPKEDQIERMIVWTADIVLDGPRYRAVDQRRAGAGQRDGGYGSQHESWIQSELLYAGWTNRVPADQYETVMARLRDQALKVEHEAPTARM